MTICCFCNFRLVKGLNGESSLFSRASCYGFYEFALLVIVPRPYLCNEVFVICVAYFYLSYFFVILCTLVSQISWVYNGLVLHLSLPWLLRLSGVKQDVVCAQHQPDKHSRNMCHQPRQ